MTLYYDRIKSRSFQLSRVRSSAGNNFVFLGPFPKRKKSHLTKSLSNLTEQLVYFWSQGQEKEKVMVISDVFRKARISLEAGKCWNCPEIPAQTVIVSLLCDTWKVTHVGFLRPLRKLSVLCLCLLPFPEPVEMSLRQKGTRGAQHRAAALAKTAQCLPASSPDASADSEIAGCRSFLE